jgi:hypothetical protein
MIVSRQCIRPTIACSAPKDSRPNIVKMTIGETGTLLPRLGMSSVDGALTRCHASVIDKTSGPRRGREAQ